MSAPGFTVTTDHWPGVSIQFGAGPAFCARIRLEKGCDGFESLLMALKAAVERQTEVLERLATPVVGPPAPPPGEVWHTCRHGQVTCVPCQWVRGRPAGETT